MTSKQMIIDAAQRHLWPGKKLVKVIARTACYSLGVMVSAYIGETYFHDTMVALVCLFTLFAIAFELVWDTAVSGPRQWVFLLTIISMMVSGFFLVQEAIHVKQEEVHTATLNKRLDDVFNRVDGPVIATDDDGTIKGVSQSVAGLTGYTQKELVGKNISLLFGEGLFDLKAKSDKMHLPGDPGWTMDMLHNVPLKKKDGTTLVVDKIVVGFRLSFSRAYVGDVQFVSIITKR